VLVSSKVLANPDPIIMSIPPIIQNNLNETLSVRDTNCPVIIVAKTTPKIKGNNSSPDCVAT